MQINALMLPLMKVKLGDGFKEIFGSDSGFGKLSIFGASLSVFDPYQTVTNLLSYETFSGSADGKTIGTVVENVNTAMVGYAAAFLMLFFIMDLAMSTIRQAENLSLIRLGYSFIRLVFWYGVCTSSLTIAKYMFSIGDGIVEATRKAVSEGKAPDGLVDGMADAINKAGGGNVVAQFFYCIVCFLALLAIIGTGIAVIVTVVGRVLRIYAYIAFMPLPIALCASEHTSHIGKRYLRKGIGLGIEAAMMLLLAVIYAQLMKSVTLTMGKGAPIANLIGYGISVSLMNSILSAAISGAQGAVNEMIS